MKRRSLTFDAARRQAEMPEKPKVGEMRVHPNSMAAKKWGRKRFKFYGSR